MARREEGKILLNDSDADDEIVEISGDLKGMFGEHYVVSK